MYLRELYYASEIGFAATQPHLIAGADLPDRTSLVLSYTFIHQDLCLSSLLRVTKIEH